MSDILDQIRAAHAARKLTKVPVPEYGFDLYFKPLTVAQRTRIRKMSGNSEEMGMVHAIIELALDKDGKRVFDVPADERPDLLATFEGFDFAVLFRVVTQSGGGLPDDVAGEISTVDCDALRSALASVFDAGSGVGKLLAASKDVALQGMLAEFARTAVASKPVKNA